MKRKKKLVNDRRNEIVRLLQERREVTVEELAESFDTSLMTIRRDLQLLEERGLIERFYGGARSLTSPKPMSREQEIAMYRDIIAGVAATMVADGDTIFINGSSTALGLLRYIGDRRVHVITNNGRSVNMPPSENVRGVLTGGRIHDGSGILVGDDAMRNLLSAYADKAFLGFAGISANGEVACDIPTEIGINELMASHCKELYIMTDYTKLGKTSSFASCSLEQRWTLITDEKADPQVVARLRDQGMRVIQVSAKDRTLM